MLQHPSLGPVVSSDDIATLFDVPAEDVRAPLGETRAKPGETVTVTVPLDWIQRGRRRFREAAAATGSEDLAGIIAYLRTA